MPNNEVDIQNVPQLAETKSQNKHVEADGV